MSIKSNYFKMDKEEFDNYLKNIKSSTNTLLFLDGKYFYYPTNEINTLLLQINKNMIEFDFLMNSFSTFARKQIIQSFLIDEIQSTNRIESINSTKHDIFSILNNVSIVKDKKTISISNSYRNLIESKGTPILRLGDIKSLYDIVLKESISKGDIVDGIYFRKQPVYISNGIKSIHEGINGEDNINKYMLEFINIYNSDNDLFLKMIISHFIFETIHPYYDGNGRLGRYLISNGIYLNTKSYFAFIISSSLEKEKSKYYKAFKDSSSQYEFGCINEFIILICQILVNQSTKVINELKQKLISLNNDTLNINFTRREKEIYRLLLEASILSNYGISNQEIINEIGVSKRTLIYILNKFKDLNLLVDTKISKTTYHKIIIE